mmetsp:Transcript_48418/g.94625  ORF Transcript_48418/g.94625 Transcript_48418/m.94625 type:complete len:603 (+) Transcript_48418:353-2161(+)
MDSRPSAVSSIRTEAFFSPSLAPTSSGIWAVARTVRPPPSISCTTSRLLPRRASPDTTAGSGSPIFMKASASSPSVPNPSDTGEIGATSSSISLLATAATFPETRAATTAEACTAHPTATASSAGTSGRPGQGASPPSPFRVFRKEAATHGALQSAPDNNTTSKRLGRSEAPTNSAAEARILPMSISKRGRDTGTDRSRPSISPSTSTVAAPPTPSTPTAYSHAIHSFMVDRGESFTSRPPFLRLNMLAQCPTSAPVTASGVSSLWVHDPTSSRHPPALRKCVAVIPDAPQSTTAHSRQSVFSPARPCATHTAAAGRRYPSTDPNAATHAVRSTPSTRSGPTATTAPRWDPAAPPAAAAYPPSSARRTRRLLPRLPSLAGAKTPAVRATPSAAARGSSRASALRAPSPTSPPSPTRVGVRRTPSALERMRTLVASAGPGVPETGPAAMRAWAVPRSTPRGRGGGAFFLGGFWCEETPFSTGTGRGDCFGAGDFGVSPEEEAAAGEGTCCCCCFFLFFFFPIIDYLTSLVSPIVCDVSKWCASLPGAIHSLRGDFGASPRAHVSYTNTRPTNKSNTFFCRRVCFSGMRPLLSLSSPDDLLFPL